MSCIYLTLALDAIQAFSLSVVPRDVVQGRDEVALEVLEFIKSHQGLLDRILRDDTPGVHLADLDELQLATAVLSKVRY